MLLITGHSAIESKGLGSSAHNLVTIADQTVAFVARHIHHRDWTVINKVVHLGLERASQNSIVYACISRFSQ